MSNYLEQILNATKAHNTGVRRTRSSLDKMVSMLQDPPAAPVAASPASGAKGGGGAGPHHSGDGHNHGGGNQSVGEANELWRRLQKMISASPHKITPGKRSRSYEEQVRLWNNYKAGKGPMAARPGTSKHGNGRANDLQYSNDAARQWALANAKNYGLAFPLYNPKLSRSRDESWHVELG